MDSVHNYKFVVHQLLPKAVSDRRQRPKMTLSFGVDPSRKSLMFTTNSPFGLNDCVEVDPNLPLDRQEYDDDDFEIITDSITPSTFLLLYVTSIHYIGTLAFQQPFHFPLMKLVPRRHIPSGS